MRGEARVPEPELSLVSLLILLLVSPAWNCLVRLQFPITFLLLLQYFSSFLRILV